MSGQEVEAVLVHEVVHVANGDMVTLTLIQGVVKLLRLFFEMFVPIAASNFSPLPLRERGRG
jgi:heat shock protein HtpX